VVYPAAGLLGYTSAKIVLINKSVTPMDSKAELVINDSIGEVFSQIKV
jgi:NAD-dependent deacetylase